MKHLAKRRDIITTTADKGGTVVIMDAENYIKEANRQLSGKNNYKILQTDSTLQPNKMVNGTLDRFKNKNLPSNKTAEGLKIIHPKRPIFYITSKIHKKENNPRRTLTPRFVDHHLQSLAKEIPAY